MKAKRHGSRLAAGIEAGRSPPTFWGKRPRTPEDRMWERTKSVTKWGNASTKGCARASLVVLRWSGIVCSLVVLLLSHQGPLCESRKTGMTTPKNLFAIAPVENCARRDLDKVVDDRSICEDPTMGHSKRWVMEAI